MIKLVPLSRANWERAVALQVNEDQADYLPSNLFTIAQSRFEPADLYGIYLDSTMIGFAAVATYSQVPWITRFMIDKNWQGQGHSHDALQQLVQRLRTKPGTHEIRASISSKNVAAEYLFHSLGFVRTGEIDEREFIMRLVL